MSIPPLVCSTPPPPDQCDDDKDHEDFDISYSLSQDDDDDEDENNHYNYGNFSSYNNFQSAPDNKPLDIKENRQEIANESETTKEVCLEPGTQIEPAASIVVHDLFGTSDINENKLKCDEDMNIEDLNLKVDEEVEGIIASNSVQIEISEPNTVNVKDFDIPHSLDNDSPSCDNINLSSFEDNPKDGTDSLTELHTDVIAATPPPIEKITNVEDNVNDDILYDNLDRPLYESDNPLKLDETVIKLEINPQTCDKSSSFSETKADESIIDDDFGDFDDFQSVNTRSIVTSIVDKGDSPWGNDDSNEFEFGNFAANFEENKNSAEDITIPKDATVSNKVEQLNIELEETDNNLEDDDDFGDFDDFKSSSIKTEANEVPVQDASRCHELPVLNLQATENEHQVLESITKVLSSVFLEEISEPETEYEGKLESLLSETWGHLMETDERQPYIVNWNNSLGQKTLLKALCIDSRNILFGPKWSSSMPKYAANLSNAPLQPQKQGSVPTSVVPPNEIVAEKSSSKPTTWNDPFTSDGQEFTYAEALLLDLEHLMATLDQMAHNHSTLKISELLSHACNTENESATITPGPTDLDVFEASASTRPDKIYSNTIGVQPLRQINLPDTHIFTPTDSEIPRSKTIHYDRGPTVLMPQVDNKNPIDIVNIPSTSPLESNIDDNEYWEFQNFKSNSDTNAVPSSLKNSQQVPSQEINLETATTVNALPKPNIAYQTELLQPIRVEHAMPTLNWPDPGEVKGAYDDFSDFVSISSQPSETQDRISSQSVESRLKNTNKQELDNFTENRKTEVLTEMTNPASYTIVDDFDTFQSAQPSKAPSQAFKSSFMENANNQMPSSHITEYNHASPKFDSIKSDTISFGSMTRPNETLPQNVGFTNKTDSTNKSSLSSSNTQMPTNLLQPTPASYSAVNTQNQQKSTQILQPLSLESYSQINWPSPGIDLQDLSRFNPVETLHSLKSDLSVSGLSKAASPSHSAKNTIVNQGPDDDVWGEFVSSKPKQQQQAQPKKPSVFVDDDEWTDFISSPSVKPINGLNTISLNVHTNSNIQKSLQNKFTKKNNQAPLDIPALNYITPKSNPHKSYNDKHFQNL